jgi:uncharacterized protein YhfF
MDHHIQAFWQTFQEKLDHASPYRERNFGADTWGDSPQLADELGRLIAAGIKTATCSCVWEWQAEGESWPEPGELTVVLDGAGQPLCIIETLDVVITSYDAVDPDFAAAEGEGDRSLAYWQEAHRRYFSRTLPKIGRHFSEDIPLVCERFKLIYP